MQKFKAKLYEIIFGTDTKAGRLFDLFLIFLIVFSILIVLLESVHSIDVRYGAYFDMAEWIITILFTLEYIVRIWIVSKPRKFIFSFFGVIDFLSCMPAYLELFISGTQGLLVIRALRLLRVFRVLKLNRYLSESSHLTRALKASRFKISIFLYAVIMLVIVIGALMYFVEGAESGFNSIPRSMYWVIVTITTVGYGDITPHTTLGQFLASFIMIIGYAIIAVPTGIVSSEITRMNKEEKKLSAQNCPKCLKGTHTNDAVFCKYCGHPLNDASIKGH